MAHRVHYTVHMKPGILRTALWVAVFVMPGGVLLLPALVLPRNLVPSRLLPERFQPERRGAALPTPDAKAPQSAKAA